MQSAPKFSLIVATAGRKEELDQLLASLCQQQLPASFFEVIICDQNPPGFLDEVLSKYKPHLDLVHIFSPKKSLSHSRNLGIQQARGSFLSFPDDDCQYYADTLQVCYQTFEQQSDIDLLLGTVYDRKKKTFVFKRTPVEETRVTKNNFHAFVSSIAIIVRNKNIKFDERFGIGERFHSNEDADLLLTCLKNGFKLVYIPTLQFYHPPYDANNMSVEKLYRYGIGFGALVRKHLSPALFYLYFKVIVFQILMITKALLQFNFTELKRRQAALNGRIKGFFLFSGN